jgi:hypothetical protein
MAETLVPAKDPADAFMKKMLDAIKAGSYEAFVADATPKMRASARGAFGIAAAHLAQQLLKGYKTTALGTLRKTGSSVHLWKLEPAGAPEDYEIRLVLEDGKVGAFSIW